MEVIKQIEKFVSSFGHGIRFPKSKWFEDDTMRVYFRVHPQMFFQSKSGDALYKRILVVSNVSVNESYQGQGIYSKFLSDVEKLGKEKEFDGIIIENVLDPAQQSIYTSRGYKKLDKPSHEHESPWFLKTL